MQFIYHYTGILISSPLVSPDQEEGLPVWLRALMILCCSCRDYGVQHTAIASFLKLVNHSQSLALVIQDKHKRYQSCNSNPLSGRLQMVTVPPVLPATLARIEQETNFYQVGLPPPFFFFSCYVFFPLPSFGFFHYQHLRKKPRQ